MGARTIAKRITLQTPIEHAGQTITEIELAECNTRESQKIPVQAKTLGDFMPLLSDLAALPPSVLGKLSGQDGAAVYRAMIELASPFLAGMYEEK